MGITAVLSFAMLVGVANGQSDEVNFNRDIRPLLSNRCFQCHGPNEKDRKAGLRLDQAGGAEGAYRTRKGKTAIKPNSLENSQLWYRITTGDLDDRMPPAAFHKKALDPAEVELIKRWILQGAKYEKFWAFIPPKPSLPANGSGGSWSKGAIDLHVMASFRRKGLKPKKQADRRTLIRRLTFDLTGLPPSLEELHAFLVDDSPRAYADVVERLLNRKEYGEHMARYWADLVRLADTAGMHKDFYRNFSTYRDWLIRAFNENLPFDDFIKYQLAGDLYPKPSEDQLVASGFNRLHLIIDKGTALPEESFHKNVLDRVEAFGTTFLGLTIKCAQCHDHKYDPISQKEFYQLYAFFNNFEGDPETRGAPKGGLQPPFVTLKESKQNTGKVMVKAMVMRERAKPRTTRFLMRGAYDAPGDIVQRNTPASLPPLVKKEGLYSRMDLAEWLVDPGHPLTARVAVNRFWQQFFGVGLVKTSEDFGSQGDWPAHPLLLDTLAFRFMESGWDVKKLVREIVMSKTYRQSSDATRDEYLADPGNRLLARGSRYRLDAEVIRDQILFLSGKLNTRMYGQSVKPPQPPGLWKAVSMAKPLTYVADKGDKIYRRSFYTFWRRGMPPPQMTIMNAPSREFCVTRRERTNTSLQALLLMNEQEYFKAAMACAERVLKSVDGNEGQGLIRVYEMVTSHRPDQKRLLLLKNTLKEFRGIYGKDRKLAESLTRGLKDVDLQRRVEVAAWTMMVHSVINLELSKVRR